MLFFTNCTTAEQAKKVYRQLAKHFHPDKGGDPALLIELQQQYESFDGPVNVKQRPKDIFSNDFIPFDHPIHQDLNRIRMENFSLRERIKQDQNQIIRHIEDLNYYKTLTGTLNVVNNDLLDKLGRADERYQEAQKIIDKSNSPGLFDSILKRLGF